MAQVILDTSFLITFADPSRVNHTVALDYFRHCLSQRVPMWLSVVAAGEFEVGQSVSDLPLRQFNILPYNLYHAIRAASLFNSLRSDEGAKIEERRPVIINDLKLLAQAHEEGISVLLTEDGNTLTKMAERLRHKGLLNVKTVLLSEGFTPGRLENPDQGEIPLNR